MLRAVSSIYVESQALELLASSRRDVYKLFRTSSLSTHSAAPPTTQTVVSSSGRSQGAAPPPASSPPPPPGGPPPARPPHPPRPAWTTAAATLAITASLGGVYLYSRSKDDKKAIVDLPTEGEAAPASDPDAWRPEPPSGADFPEHVQYLLVGAGTASFAAMRAIRSARPDARVLLVGAEPEPPYMRPPLSKELWREPEPAAGAFDALSFRQWNGRRRPLAYEPPAFYTPVARLAESAGGAAVARGWRVARLDVERHEAELEPAGGGAARVSLRYDKALVGTGLRARRAPELRGAAGAGRSLVLRGVRDARRLARELERPGVRRVAVLGGGLLASELSAALAERLRPAGKEVLQLFREEAPLARLLPGYLAAEAARRLREAGAELAPGAEVLEGAPRGAGVRLLLADGSERLADLVVECVGGEADEELARASQLETDPALGGLLVNAELLARTDVYAAGDAACFYDVVLGRRRVEHHDHAVVSGRLAGENMAAVAPPKPYKHQSMFWSDLGPQLGYEAIGIIDSRLRTVGVFSSDAVTDEARALVAPAPAAPGAPAAAPAPAAPGAPADEAGARRYSRGVVFYVRDERVVGVLLWNLFNRMHVARQVLAHGKFDDLFEVAKLFALHEDE